MNMYRTKGRKDAHRWTIGSAATVLTVVAPALHADELLAANTPAESVAEVVVVTGTRVTGLSAAESPAPIQVLGAAQLQSAGKPDLMQALANIVPSFTAQAFGGDMANQTLQAKLRGLSPNHVLVLVNGKRRHTTASLAVLGGPYQGGAGVDLNFIPVDAIDHVEVLTEGAAAQYGTDAIAGVVNIILKKNSSGGNLGYNYGEFFQGDGATNTVSGNAGFEPSPGSYLSFTGEVRNHAHTNRGGIDPRVIDPARIDPASGGTFPNTNMPLANGYPYLNQIQGDAEYDLKIASFNAGATLGDSAEFYAFGTWGDKHATSFENYRLPSRVSYENPDTGAVTYLYPFGFSPTEETEETDYSATAGFKGTLGDWRWDVASTYGKDDIDLFTRNSANASLYAATGATPTNFYDGTYSGTQWTTNLDVGKDFEIGLAGPLNVALGTEYRRERWRSKEGDAASRYLEGGQSFPGIGLGDAGGHERTNYAGYVDLAVKPIEGLFVDLAGRYEHYSDFGNTTVGKLTARYDFSPTYAVRGTLSTGFRAPTLAEEFYSATNVGPRTAFVQLPPNAPATALLGLGDGLQPEKSTNYSFGFVMRPTDAMAMTVDFYQVEVRNRIAATSTFYGTIKGVLFSQPIVDAIIANGNVLDPEVTAEGDTGINLFTNGVTTRTRGVDVVFDYITDFGPARVDWSVGGTYTSTEVTKVRATPAELGAANQALFDQVALSDLEDTAPKYVLNLGGTLSLDKLTVSLHEVIYGKSSEFVSDNGDDTGTPVPYRTEIGVAAITNLDVSFEVMDGLKVTVGAYNLFDQFPDKQNSDLLAIYRAAGDNSAVTIYPSFSPFGINGGYYYGKLSYKF